MHAIFWIMVSVVPLYCFFEEVLKPVSFCFCFSSSEDCGHVPHLEQPSVTADMIASFMGSTTL